MSANLVAISPTLALSRGNELFSTFWAKVNGENAQGSESNAQKIQVFMVAAVADLAALSQEIEAQKPIIVTNASPVFTSDNTYQDYGYKGAITVTGCTADMRPEVVFGAVDAVSGNYAAVCESGAGVVYIYAKTNVAITIPLVVIHKQ